MLANNNTTTTPLQAAIAVRDPLRTGYRVLQVPISAVLPTRASRGPRPPQDQQLSLCLLFQVNQCTSGDACRHVHVAPKDVAAARQACDRLPAAAPIHRSCCAAHDGSAPVATAAGFQVQIRGRPSLSLGASAFAPTQALNSLVEDLPAGAVGPINIGCMRVCRSHVDGHCKLGAACRNVHVCRHAWCEATRSTAGGAVTLPPIVPSAQGAPHPPAAPRPQRQLACPATSLPEIDGAAPAVTASAKLTPHPPTPPARAVSPTQQCLARFVRRWNNPNIRSSGASNFTAMESEDADTVCLNASLEERLVLLGMTDALKISTGSSCSFQVHTPTPPSQTTDGRTSFDRQFFSIVA